MFYLFYIYDIINQKKFNHFIPMHTISIEASKNMKGGDKMNESQLHEQITEVSKTIFSFCLIKTSNRQDAEDLSQDIILELFKSVKNIRDDKAFYGFMWAVAENVYKQWYKKKLKSKTCELTDDIANTLIDFEPDNNSDIYLLRRELSLLSEKYRKATILYYIDGYNCHQIADKINLSESMVKYLLFKSRKILKEGMNMERKLGELSYNPKNLIPLYNGSGPNRFCDFMNHKMRQNIVNACYNDSLTDQQISLETGIPLPYIDDELKALVDKAIIIKEGTHYKANVIVITTECTEEIRRNVEIYHRKIADIISEFLDKYLGDFKEIGFVGADFSDNSLRWQLMTYVLAAITLYNTDVLNTNDASSFPKTAWGDNAYIWLVEKDNSIHDFIFNISQENSRQGDRIHFFDYLPNPKGDHHDFYGNERYVNILCDVARHNCENFSEYDLEAVADMIKKGYVLKHDESYKVTMPVLTLEQYNKVVELVSEFINHNLKEVILEMDATATKILSEHTPKHLQSQVAGIASMDKYINAVCIPTKILIERNVLNTNWNSRELPTTFIVLNK